ncbi:MAG: ankyrin repeat domain-containing protein [Chlamydiia bacterium]|nr:ankyrin repeat domain-containing protein [Chlamydiia bacterium]
MGVNFIGFKTPKYMTHDPYPEINQEPFDFKAAQAFQQQIETGEVEKALTQWEQYPKGAALPNGELPLSYAIRWGQHAIVEGMLKSKSIPDIDDLDPHRLTAVDHAMLTRDQKMIALVTAAKLKIEWSRAKEHFSDHAEGVVRLKQANSLLSQFKKNASTASLKLEGAFQSACEGKYDQVVEKLKAGEVTPNSTLTEGWSLLHLAVKGNDLRLVRYLLNTGAFADLQTSQTKITPLHLAAHTGNPEMVRLLLDSKGDLNALDANGYTPLHYAAASDDPSAMRLLIARGADISQKPPKGLSPIALKIARLAEQSDQKDELKLGFFETVFGAGLALSLLALCLPSGNQNLDAFKFIAKEVTLGALAAGNLDGFWFNAFAFTNISGMKSLSEVYLGNRALAITGLGKSLLSKLRTAWEYRHIEWARPARNIGLAALPLATAAYDLYAKAVALYFSSDLKRKANAERVLGLSGEYSKKECQKRVRWLRAGCHPDWNKKSIKSCDKAYQNYTGKALSNYSDITALGNKTDKVFITIQNAGKLLCPK